MDNHPKLLFLLLHRHYVEYRGVLDSKQKFCKFPVLFTVKAYILMVLKSLSEEMLLSSFVFTTKENLPTMQKIRGWPVSYTHLDVDKRQL